MAFSDRLELCMDQRTEMVRNVVAPELALEPATAG